jgi:hypothetical protein
MKGIIVQKKYSIFFICLVGLTQHFYSLWGDEQPLLPDPALNCCPQPLPFYPAPEKLARVPKPCCPRPVCRPTRVLAPRLPKCRTYGGYCRRPRTCRPKVRCAIKPKPCRRKPVCCQKIRCCRPKPKCCPPVIPPCPKPKCIAQPTCPEIPQFRCPYPSYEREVGKQANSPVRLPITMADAMPPLEQPQRNSNSTKPIDQALGQL